MLHSLHGCSHGWYISTPVFDYKWQQLQSNVNMFNLEISTCWKTTSRQRMLFMQSVVNESIMCCLRQNLQTILPLKRATSIKRISTVLFKSKLALDSRSLRESRVTSRIETWFSIATFRFSILDSCKTHQTGTAFVYNQLKGFCFK